MGRIVVSIELDATPAEVWAVVEPIERHVDWMADAVTIHVIASPQPLDHAQHVVGVFLNPGTFGASATAPHAARVEGRRVELRCRLCARPFSDA